jgi:hypothetical protein
MKQYDESRTSLFQRIDRPALQPLRECAYQYTYIKNVRVNIDYHVEIEKHYYCLPYSLVKKQLAANITGQLALGDKT